MIPFVLLAAAGYLALARVPGRKRQNLPRHGAAGAGLAGPGRGWPGDRVRPQAAAPVGRDREHPVRGRSRGDRR